MIRRRELARVLHESRLDFCWGRDKWKPSQPWPDKLPGDFGYVPQPWVDIAFAQADAVLKLLDGEVRP